MSGCRRLYAIRAFIPTVSGRTRRRIRPILTACSSPSSHLRPASGRDVVGRRTVVWNMTIFWDVTTAPGILAVLLGGCLGALQERRGVENERFRRGGEMTLCKRAPANGRPAAAIPVRPVCQDAATRSSQPVLGSGERTTGCETTQRPDWRSRVYGDARCRQRFRGQQGAVCI